MKSNQVGKVFLVGAGPGDPELLTLKAVRALAIADVILIDDLVNRDVLQHASADARVIEVGKRGGCKSTPQTFIEKLMITEAKAGYNVVRLKGGDPFMFGRGGEECASLRAENIQVEVIGGITSGMAAPAALGIPVTHRDVCHGVIFVTGHGKGDESPNWQALAQTGLTLVIYMAIGNLAEIAAALERGGLSGDTPACAIQHATLANQRQVVSTLQNLAHKVNAVGLSSPGIVVIGNVVRYHHVVRQDILAAARLVA